MVEYSGRTARRHPRAGGANSSSCSSRAGRARIPAKHKPVVCMFKYALFHAVYLLRSGISVRLLFRADRGYELELYGVVSLDAE
ncbi:hypothetical protein NDU88_003049 [Pleurodeles waltl]|uniref:Uncharacterized protein n=1 Tax=Pleurodeles waltl TaxID=8319 RepID=A0AAV7WRP0_PLEWA|nr:hypothetical protein NDU88_003049 [Pleurodeles waltl]